MNQSEIARRLGIGRTSVREDPGGEELRSGSRWQLEESEASGSSSSAERL